MDLLQDSTADQDLQCKECRADPQGTVDLPLLMATKADGMISSSNKEDLVDHLEAKDQKKTVSGARQTTIRASNKNIKTASSVLTVFGEGAGVHK